MKKHTHKTMNRVKCTITGRPLWQPECSCDHPFTFYRHSEDALRAFRIHKGASA